MTISAPETFLKGRVSLFCGDCIDVLAGMDEGSVDSVVCDPPYHLTSIVKRFSKEKPDDVEKNFVNRKTNGQGVSPYKRTARGFMGKQWDGGDIAFRPETWAAVLRVLKPGGHLVAFSGTRTYHRMACAIEDAGFEIRDQIGWAYGTGFPKSHNVKSMVGWGTALKPAWEPIVLARKPLIGTVAENVLAHGTGGLNIDGCRVGTSDGLNGGRYSDNKQGDDGNTYGSGINLRSSAAYTQPEGRWPANIITDGSAEVLETFPDAPGQQRYVGPEHGERPSRGIYGDFGARPPNEPRGDSGSAARFFYTAKADADDRLGSKHPTVKPLDLMQWLVRFVTPPGGMVLDPFAGTGTTAEAAWREGFCATIIEREPEYQNDCRRRMSLALSGMDERARAAIKAKTAGKPEDNGPLFKSLDIYDAQADFAGSLEVGYQAIRERVAAGGPGWQQNKDGENV